MKIQITLTKIGAGEVEESQPSLEKKTTTTKYNLQSN